MRIILIIVFIIILLLQLVYLTINNEFVPLSKKYQELQDETQGIKKVNILLREQVLDDEAFTNILTKSKRMGFVDAKYVYLEAE